MSRIIISSSEKVISRNRLPSQYAYACIFSISLFSYLIMRGSPDCPRLCPGCPLVPEDVTAELTSLAMLTEQEKRSYKYGGEGPASGRMADEHLSGVLRATFTVIESTNPEVETGDSAEQIINTRGRTHQQIRDAFEGCEEPVDKPNRFARAMGKTATCGPADKPFKFS